jgi:FtsP/CotA-like multicopper oxidase with cupredoxin domain
MGRIARQKGPQVTVSDYRPLATIPRMDTQLAATHPDVPSTLGPKDEAASDGLSRRGFLRGAAIAGGGLVAAGIAACAPAGAPTWTYAPAPATPAAAGSASPTPPTSAAASLAASPSAAAASGLPAASGSIPAGWTQMDVDARAVVRRYIGNLAPALKDIYGDAAFAKLADILGAADGYPELQAKPSFVQVPQLFLTDALQPLKPELDGDVKAFKFTIDEISQQIDEVKPPVAALGYNKQWPGPTIRVNQGDKVRAIFTNNLKESTGVHFHGVQFDDFFQDGVPFVTQKPIAPGETHTYEFTANNAGSMMYHSHHNATDQVGRSLLGAFLVEPKTRLVKADREYVWISNDTLGGFTINGHGFPTTVPVLAAVGETVLIRFMNEGVMMHPWHSHGYVMKVVARVGRPLGTAALSATPSASTPANATTSRSRSIAPASGRSTATSCRTPKGRRGCMAWSTR